MSQIASRTARGAACFLFVAAASVAAIEIDPQLPDYRPVSGVSGRLKSVGSDTLNNLMTLWAEGFNALYPAVSIEIEGKGSSTAPPALIAGTAHFGPMSRPMKGNEIDQFERRFGYKPSAIRGAIDALGIYVHKDNPIACLTLPQVDAIFSKTRLGGYPRDVRTWGDLGLTGEYADRPIALYGRNSASGTYGYFKDVALYGGDFKDSVKELPGSSTVVQGVASDRFGIGYSGVGYKTADVRAVPIAEREGEPCYELTPENTYAGRYPIARFLYIYFNKHPARRLDPLRAEFIRFVYSRQGQEAVIRDGYYPITAFVAREDLEAFDLAVD